MLATDLSWRRAGRRPGSCALLLAALAACTVRRRRRPPTAARRRRRRSRACSTGTRTAVLRHDRGAFLADLDGGARGRRRSARRQAASSPNLAAAAAATLELPRSVAVDRRPTARAGRDASATARRRSSCRSTLQLRAARRRPGAHPARPVVDVRARRRARRGSPATRDLAAVGGTSWQGPWDFGPLVVARGAARARARATRRPRRSCRLVADASTPRSRRSPRCGGPAGRSDVAVRRARLRRRTQRAASAPARRSPPTSPRWRCPTAPTRSAATSTASG